MRKKILVVCMCFTLVFAVTAQDIKEVKAIAPAIPIVVIGAIALGGGVYFANKDDLQSMASDCMDWLKDNVVDAYNDAVNLVANGGKYIVTGALTSGVYAYLKHKYGWGSTDTPITSVTRDLATLNAPALEILQKARQKCMAEGTYNFDLDSWMEINKEAYWGIVDKGNNEYFVFPYNPDITDIVFNYYSADYYSFSYYNSVGEKEANLTIGNNIYLSLSDGHSKIQTLYYSACVSPLEKMFYEDKTTREERLALISVNEGGYLPGINVWGDEIAFYQDNKTSSYYYGVFPGNGISLDIGYNTALQTEDTAITIPTVGEMTIDEFIDATKDLAIDDTPAWIDVIDKIIATDTDVDVPTDTPNEDTKPSVPPLVSDFTADLTSIFPFCLPFDLIDLVKALSTEPVAPKWEIPIKFKYGTVVDYKQTFVLDMKDYESVVKIFRTLETIGFIVGLIMITRNQMIKG